MEQLVGMSKSKREKNPNKNHPTVHWLRTEMGWTLGCSKKTLLLSIILAVESLVRMGLLSNQKKFQNYRPVNDP